jgi:Ca-activated chloride channel homolog
VRRVVLGAPHDARGALAALAALSLLVLLTLVTIRGTGVAQHPAMESTANATAAESLYRAGSYREALDAFRRIAREKVASPQRDLLPALDYNSGNALYRMGHYDESIMHFRGALAGQSSLRERSDYNLGDTYMKKADVESNRSADLRAAISAYEEALLLEPSDADARWNLELTLRKLADADARVGAGRRRAANWGGGNLTKSGYAGTPQTGAGAAPGGGFGGSHGEQPVRQITETRARQLLKAIERAQVTGQEGRGGSPSHMTSHTQDW